MNLKTPFLLIATENYIFIRVKSYPLSKLILHTKELAYQDYVLAIQVEIPIYGITLFTKTQTRCICLWASCFKIDQSTKLPKFYLIPMASQE
jgi:hypothetical protein